MAARDVGVPQLGRLLTPIPDNSTLVLVNDPGIEAEPFLYQAAFERLREGGTVVYAATNRPIESIVRAMKEFGFDVTAHQDRLFWLDAYSPLLGMAGETAYATTIPGDAAEFARTIDRAGRDHPDALLIIDSLSQLIDVGSYESFRDVVPQLQDAMKRFDMTEALFTRWPYGDDLDELLSMFDSRVALRGVEDRVTVSQYFRLERAAWLDHADANPRIYRSLKPGGIHVFIPKIVITGPYNAGKSSFVQSVSDRATSADRLGTTVALDHGHVVIDGLTADIFGTPGQARFDPILRVVSGQAVGVVVVVDATKPESFARAKEMLSLTWKKGIPGIIAANKQDLPDALPPEEVARLIAPPEGVQVVGCSGEDRESSRHVLRLLIDRILTEVPPA